MKILLIQPPVRDFYETDIRLQPIGLCYIKAALKKHIPEARVVIRDYHHGCGRRTVALPRELSYLREYYHAADRSPFSTFHQYYHFGRSFEEIGDDVMRIRPDAVGISSLFTPYFREALGVARLVRQRLQVPVIMGGPHVSEVPQSVLACADVDYVIRGEGERPMVELVRALMGRADIGSVPNLGHKKGNTMHLNPLHDNYPLNELPFPDLGDFPAERYTFAGKPFTFIITSRGCPHQCSFCSVHTTFGKGYRRRSPADILAEIAERFSAGYRVMDFEDDNLTFRREEFMELCRRIIDAYPHRSIDLTAMNGISYMSLDGEMLVLMKKAGFTHVNLALVSSDGSVCGNINRPHDLNVYETTVNRAFHLGLKTVSYQILGLPGETLQGMVRTFAFHARLPVLLGASPFYLTPNAPLARGLSLSGEDYVKARLTALGTGTDSNARDDIYTLFVAARIINFLKGLGVTESVSMEGVLDKEWKDGKTSAGIGLLKDLWLNGVLYSLTAKGRVANRKFRTDLFVRVIRESRYITCLNGRRIAFNNFPPAGHTE